MKKVVMNAVKRLINAVRLLLVCVLSHLTSLCVYNRSMEVPIVLVAHESIIPMLSLA